MEKYSFKFKMIVVREYLNGESWALTDLMKYNWSEIFTKEQMKELEEKE